MVSRYWHLPEDKAGNTGIAAGFTAPDTRVPEAPIITNVVDDVGIYTGAIANGQSLMTHNPH